MDKPLLRMMTVDDAREMEARRRAADLEETRDGCRHSELYAEESECGCEFCRRCKQRTFKCSSHCLDGEDDGCALPDASDMTNGRCLRCESASKPSRC